MVKIGSMAIARDHPIASLKKSTVGNYPMNTQPMDSQPNGTERTVLLISAVGCLIIDCVGLAFAVISASETVAARRPARQDPDGAQSRPSDNVSGHDL
jgi:hypothetical protein